MNRLVLVGNEFDLAHGMKTSYLEFLTWYLKKTLHTAQTKQINDGLVKVTYTHNYGGLAPQNIIDMWVNDCVSSNFELSKLGAPRLEFGSTNNYNYPFQFDSNDSFFNKLMERCRIERWVDVESVFYQSLLSLTKLFNAREADGLNALNKSMKVIVDQLQEYLSGLSSPHNITEYSKIITGPFKKDDFESKRIDPHLDVITENPNRIMIVNFNYTDTVRRYIPSSKTELMHIHGKLNDQQNPIIFGFGDELDANYPQLETKTNKDFFRYIKSFEYLRTENYKNLVRFVNSEEFQVIVLGHSCGLSDRTMLNMILENPDCRSIKIYYHGDTKQNNYNDITYEVARHFKNKETFRRRVVSLERSEPMPQYYSI